MTTDTRRTRKPLNMIDDRKKFPIVEIFGPVIQGEGCMTGEQTLFIRFGGCDFRCSWCDSMYAVDPDQVKANANYLNCDEILTATQQIGSHCKTVTISGGNPVIHDISDLIAYLKNDKYKIAVETQGTIWRDWLHACDVVTISPKGPSSGMSFNRGPLYDMFRQLMPAQTCLKIVVFNEGDYEFASDVIYDIRHTFGYTESYLMAGSNTKYRTHWDDGLINYEQLAKYREEILVKAKWLGEKMCKDSNMKGVKLGMQLHALVYGNVKGV